MSDFSAAIPHHDHKALLFSLEKRGMTISDPKTAEQFLKSVGYARLSNFWYPCRMPNPHASTPLQTFQPGTRFEDIIALYHFDKHIRLLLLEAIEQIEVAVRTYIAHYLGAYHPCAYSYHKLTLETQTIALIHNKFIDSDLSFSSSSRPPYQKKPFANNWQQWHSQHESRLQKSKLDCIVYFKNARQPVPFWFAIETWDFGCLSHYYKMLNGHYKNQISDFFLRTKQAKTFEHWLHCLNDLRNRCAHHNRVWNHTLSNPLPFPQSVMDKTPLSRHAAARLHGMVRMIAHLLERIAPQSDWLKRVYHHLRQKPEMVGCTFSAMGFEEAPSI